MKYSFHGIERYKYYIRSYTSSPPLCPFIFMSTPFRNIYKRVKIVTVDGCRILCFFPLICFRKFVSRVFDSRVNSLLFLFLVVFDNRPKFRSFFIWSSTRYPLRINRNSWRDFQRDRFFFSNFTYQLWWVSQFSKKINKFSSLWPLFGPSFWITVHLIFENGRKRNTY